MPPKRTKVKILLSFNSNNRSQPTMQMSSGDPLHLELWERAADFVRTTSELLRPGFFVL